MSGVHLLIYICIDWVDAYYVALKKGAIGHFLAPGAGCGGRLHISGAKRPFGNHGRRLGILPESLPHPEKNPPDRGNVLDPGGAAA